MVVREETRVSKGLIAGIVAGVIILIVISGVLLWKVKVYNRKFKELTQAELMLFETGDPSSINPELGLDDQVGNSNTSPSLFFDVIIGPIQDAIMPINGEFYSTAWETNLGTILV